MNIQLQALILAILILLSVTITQVGDFLPPANQTNQSGEKTTSSKRPPNLSYERASLLDVSGLEVGLLQSPELEGVKRAPLRRWEVLDPAVKAKAVLIQSLDERFSFLSYNAYKSWPMASLTKLLTALLVLEHIGENKKILIDDAAVATEGEAGGLRSGEVFTSRDLLKIMLLTSSNDAAAAFENYIGKDEFVRLMNQKAREIGMTGTLIFDGSGLDDRNITNASDLMKLARFILEKEPKIFNWSRLLSELVQPLNDITSRTIYNINELATESYFLGGKTGTSETAGQNLVALVSFGGRKFIAVILGSPDRKGELEAMMRWVEEAYNFQ